MVYLLPTPPELKGRFNGLGRLYARPSRPEPLDGAELCVLDNGAWGMHQRGLDWTEPQLRSLDDYYRSHGGEDRPPWAGVSPDVYLDPVRTLKLHDWWSRRIGRRLGPVVQFAAAKDRGLSPFSLRLVAEQLAVYRHLSPGIVFVSNPGLTGLEAGDARFLDVVAAVRELFPGSWVHVLGAGWSLDDVRAWVRTGVDSIDSIAYYTDAKRGRAWSRPGHTWADTAVLNAVAAGLVAAGHGLPPMPQPAPSG